MPRYYTTAVGYAKFTIDERYVDLKPIGDGSYGLVASAKDTITGDRVAIKKIKDALADATDAKRILREMKLLRHFRSHENIITLLDIMVHNGESSAAATGAGVDDFNDIYLVTNLMESDLERIINSRQTLSDQHIQFFLYQILRGLKYIHSAQVLHRDLKPGNLLVNANCDLALADFGLSRGFDFDGDTMTEYVVTRWYRAPELLCECAHYGKPVDVWSVGCIVAELFRHEPLFMGETPQRQLDEIVAKLGCPPRSELAFIESQAAFDYLVRWERRPRPAEFSSHFPRDTNPQALDLLQRMLTINPEARMTADQALRHPYLQHFQSQISEPVCDELFNFDYERSEIEGPSKALTRRDIQRLMLEELAYYRPQEAAVLMRQLSSSPTRIRTSSSSGSSAAAAAADYKHVAYPSISGSGSGERDSKAYGASPIIETKSSSSSSHADAKHGSAEEEDMEVYFDAQSK